MENSDIYLKDLKVDSYKSLKDSSIELQMGLNIIIGKNGAGKSNLLDFIDEYVGGDLFALPLNNINADFELSLAYTLKEVKNIWHLTVKKLKKSEKLADEDSSVQYTLTINRTEDSKKVTDNMIFQVGSNRMFISSATVGEKTFKEYRAFNSLRKKYITFELPVDSYWVSKPNRLNMDLYTNFESVNSTFSFFRSLEFEIENEIDFKEVRSAEEKKDANLLKGQLSSYMNSYLERTSINSILNDFTPITAIRFNPNLNIYFNEKTTIIENLSIDFLIEGDWMPWSYLSDGTKRLFYLISECLTLESGIILVEEPELGVHPHQLLKVLDFLKEQARTKQVIITTHSPLTLDILEETDLDRIIIAKYEKGTRFYKLTEEEENKAKRYINEVGELSYYWLHSDLEK